jgi:Rrf2 family protein
VQLSAKVDYAVRALVVIAASDSRMTRDELSAAQDIPPRYLEDVLVQLRRFQLVESQRGNAGGYVLARPAHLISIADIARAVDGPLALVQGERPGTVRYEPPCERVTELWVALRAAIRNVLEKLTIADLLSAEQPPLLAEFLADPDVWKTR